MSDVPDKSLALWAKCRKCDHCWAVAYYPMNVIECCRIAKNSYCPKCGDKHPFVAKQNEGKLLEVEKA